MEKEQTGLNFDKGIQLAQVHENYSDVRFEDDVQGPAASEFNQMSPVKRKKLDKDSFVTPTTPDIPKTSIHSVIQGLETDHSQNNIRQSHQDKKTDRDLMTHSIPHPGAANQGVVKVAENTGLSESGREQFSHLTPGCEGDGQSATDIEQLLCKFGQEAKQYQLMMAEHFRNSTRFEELLPQRVHNILEDVLALEQQLLEQKERLKARLQMVGQTLQQE